MRAALADSRFRRFLVVWLGQVASLLGTGMTRFALAVYVYEQTNAATPVVLIGIFATIPSIVGSLFAGVLVDRWNRKRTIIISDLGSGLATVLLLAFLLGDQLQTWQIYLTAAIGGISNIFQYLAFSAAITTMVPKEQYSRASSMMSLAEYSALIGAPVMAGVLLNVIDIGGIFVIDVATFLIATFTVLISPIPQPEPEATNESERLSFLREMSTGFRIIFSQTSYMWLLFLLFAFNTVESVSYPLIAPMILARTGGATEVLGTVQSVMGIGGVMGGIVMSVWGGPGRRIYGVIIGVICTGLFGDALIGIAQSPALWIVAAFGLEVFIPMVIASNATIWRSKVKPAMHGRVFATISFLIRIAGPPVSLISGIITDQVFEPAMQPSGQLADVFGGLVGTGDGAGMALLFVFSGTLIAVIGLLALFVPAAREIDLRLPDYDAVST